MIGALPRFVLLYGALFAAFGAASPFLPGLLEQRGLAPAQIGEVLAAGTAVRLLAGPAGGRVADRTGARRGVLLLLTAAAAVVATFYALPGGFGWLLLVSVLHATVLAPMVPLADAITLLGAVRYGLVRGAGSAAFVIGVLGAGQLVEHTGLPSIVWLNAALLALSAPLAALLPRGPTAPPAERRGAGLRDLLRVPGFPTVLLVAALVLGSHAMHDAFEVLRWRDAGIGPGLAGVLWSEAVVAEVVVFVGIGGPLLAWLGPRRAMMLAAAAGVLRWGVVASTASATAMALTEPLHGLTFALLHLAVMRVIATTVPLALGVSAQAVYGTLAAGTAGALLTLASGPLYAAFGAHAFWAMAILCAAAILVATRLR